MNGRVDIDLALLAKNWWIVALRGAAAILFGILTAIVPGLSLAALVMLFGAYALIEGGFNIIAAVRGATGDRPWWALLLEGIVSVAAGVIAFVMPGLTALALVYLIAAWAVFTGILEIAAAVRLRKHITGEWWLALTGVLSIAFGVLVAFFPGAGALAMVLWIGAYSIVFGILLLAVAFKLRRVRDDVEGRRMVAHAT
jgi:uncharacterized membrane protein HdeD (DUF308 family)